MSNIIIHSIEITNYSKTSTGVDGGVDADFTLTIAGEDEVVHTIDGECTLIQDHNGEFSSWGEPAHWLDGRTLDALYSIPGDALPVAARAILGAVDQGDAEDALAD